ncbi:hypothetical protein MAPG_05802 [Magnaporthiopsis poae ATCC 64411]|uniref:Heterokaryon incompatibility domain-containing protein n=1 Tax=Magnaporthiopsis poae (strain ATCC 64411 / 73-15) TaxID=644358 RepID=A0A0C4CSF2_MAGP6|nr:hypothetical protein, variant [Magnaporthiopsis poae ATCC 64411]KLU86793.1 hypothetical protein MAPG_05802 [Magnaporthiopsis poae ATCC 64411]
MDTYRYNPIDLATDAIRLVRLFSSAGDDDAPIKCELVETFLHQVEGVPYEALSYTWGTASDRFNIEIESRTHAVTPNLHQALRSLRRSDEDRMLWVDAICIDQTNDKERGHQVGQMTLIYRLAERVLIWLGPGDWDTDMLLDWMDQLDRRVVSGPNYKRTSIDCWRIECLDLLGGLGDGIVTHSSSLSKENVSRLPALFNAPWFRRVWVLQEAANARTAIIMCGRRAVASRTFSLVPLLLNINVDEGTQSVLDILPGPRRGSSWWKERRDLETLLTRFAAHEATDQVDRIYALFGISSDICTSSLLRPDYEIDPCRTVQNTMGQLLLSNITDQPLRESLTAMLPRWDVAKFMSGLPRLRREVFRFAITNNRKKLAVHVLPALSFTDLNEPAPHFADIIDPTVSVVVNYRSKPLLWDAQNELEGVVRLLVEAGADKEAKDHCGRTLLPWAAQNGYEGVARLLLEAGADKEATGNGSTPLNWAVEFGTRTAPMDTLVKYSVQHFVPVHLITHKEAKSPYGLTPLLWAVKKGNESVASLLLKAGADKEAKDADGFTPLLWAAKNRNESVASLLVNAGADKEAKGADGFTPLFWAVRHGRQEGLVRLLVEAGADKEAKDDEGLTPLNWAVEFGYEGVVKLLQ